jgi:DNA polymerase III epsilon subunit-like protein
MEHNFIVLDIETSGVNNNSSVIQIAYNIYNKDFEFISKHNYYLDDNTNRIDYYKKISLETIKTVGKPPEQVLIQLLLDIDNNSCNYIIGHNIDFDIRHIVRYYIKYNINNYDSFLNLNKIDTMKMSKQYVDARNKNNKPKFPKLEELYFKLFNCEMNSNNAHSADYDIHVTFMCFQKLTELQINKQSSFL